MGSTTETRSALCVLASGSRGNCSAVVTHHADGNRDVVLFDLGLSPRRTRQTLESIGVSIEDVRGAVLTHLDSDHCHTGWAKGRGNLFPLYLHERHMGRAERTGFLNNRAVRFNAEQFEVASSMSVRATLMSHDQLGVAAFRVELSSGATLGYATDVGHGTQDLAEHLNGVDVLAIESNYCPYLQKTSPRPSWLKNRIMGGSGHLSNAQSAELVRAIAPAQQVVLLHLSQECNKPETALRAHDTDALQITVSGQNEPTPWIDIEPSESPAVSSKIVIEGHKQHALFGPA